MAFVKDDDSAFVRDDDSAIVRNDDDSASVNDNDSAIKRDDDSAFVRDDSKLPKPSSSWSQPPTIKKWKSKVQRTRNHYCMTWQLSLQ